MPSKLVPHVMIGGHGLALDFMRQTDAKFVKLVDDFGAAVEYADLPSKPLVIGRVVEDWYDPNRERIPAQNYIARFLDQQILANPAVQAWEGPNEIVLDNLEAMGHYASFLADFCKIMREQYGKIPVIGNWATGTPDLSLWQAYEPALEAVLKYSGYLGRHEYGGPDRNTDTWLLLRCIRDNREFSFMGYPDVPLLITECGADHTPGNPGGEPWKVLKWTEEQYRDYLATYDRALTRLPFVKAATLFSYGGSWESYKINDKLNQLLIQYSKDNDMADHLDLFSVLLARRDEPADNRILQHVVDMVMDFNARGDVYFYGPATAVTVAPYWTTLKVNVDKIKIAKATAPVYRDQGKTFWQEKPKGYVMDVRGVTDDWIRVLNDVLGVYPTGLWVRAQDCEKV